MTLDEVVLLHNTQPQEEESVLCRQTLDTHQKRRPGDDLLSCYLFDPCRVTNRYSEHEDLSCGGTILQRGGSSLLWLSFGLRKSVFCDVQREAGF